MIADLSSGVPEPHAISGRRAEEVRAVGRQLHKAGGKQGMLAARDRFREQHGWASGNLETIWSSMPEWTK